MNDGEKIVRAVLKAATAAMGGRPSTAGSRMERFVMACQVLAAMTNYFAPTADDEESWLEAVLPEKRPEKPDFVVETGGITAEVTILNNKVKLFVTGDTNPLVVRIAR